MIQFDDYDYILQHLCIWNTFIWLQFSDLDLKVGKRLNMWGDSWIDFEKKK